MSDPVRCTCQMRDDFKGMGIHAPWCPLHPVRQAGSVELARIPSGMVGICERGCGLAFVSLAWPGEGKRRALCLRHGAEVVRAADALQVPREELAVCIFGRDGELIPWPRPK